MADTTRTSAAVPPRPVRTAGESRSVTRSPGPGPAELRRALGNRTTMRLLGAEGAGGGTPRVGPATLAALRNRADGRPVPDATRRSMERSLGEDLGGVRVHTGEGAAAAARELGAEAFSSGADVYFASGAFRPGTGEGRRLLAHELTHTVQQPRTGPADVRSSPSVSRPGDAAEREADAVAARVAGGQPVGTITGPDSAHIMRQAAAPAASEATVPGPTAPAQTPATGGPSGAPAMPAEEVSLAGSGTFAPSPTLAAHLEAFQGRGGAPVAVRFGRLAAGTLDVAKGREGWRTTGRGPQPLPVTHPALTPLTAAAVQPVLAVTIRSNVVTGYLSLAREGRGAPQAGALLDWIRANPAAMGWVGFDVGRFPKPVNELKDGVLRFQVTGFDYRLAGFLDGTADFGLQDETVTFRAAATVHVQGLTDAQLEIERDETGALHGRIEVPVSLQGFSGNILAVYGNGTLDVTGTARYQTDKLSGEVTLLVTDAATARDVALSRLGPEAVQAAAEEAAAPATRGRGPRPGARALAGWGVLQFAFTEWLTGQAQVIVDNRGNVTVVGEIRPPAEVELFPQRDFVRNLFTYEVRARYGVPLVGNLFLFANIGMDAVAKLGPGKIYNIVVEGTYSTDPRVFNRFSLAASLNISAFAGLRMRAEGGAGIEVADHDLKAGVGVDALAGVRGYVEATPTIGYREVAAPEEGKQGEFFLRGHLELGAQPFLGLSGDLFVELDSPWWSPAPDKKWTWPIGSLEYPLPGEFGIGADIDYVLGSGQTPEIQFGEVDFNSERFLTDLVNDHVPPKAQGEQEKEGSWQEEPAPAPAEPQLTDSQGAPPAGEVAQGQQQPGEGDVPDPAVQDKWLSGLQALGGLAQIARRDPLDARELSTALASIKREHGFRSLDVTRSGSTWLVSATMNPKTEEPLPIPAEGFVEHRAGEGEGPLAPGPGLEAEVEAAIEGASAEGFVQAGETYSNEAELEALHLREEQEAERRLEAALRDEGVPEADISQALDRLRQTFKSAKASRRRPGVGVSSAYIQSLVDEAKANLRARGVSGLHPTAYGGVLHTELRAVVERKLGRKLRNGSKVFNDQPIRRLKPMPTAEAQLTVAEWLRMRGHADPGLSTKVLSQRVGELKPDVAFQEPGEAWQVIDLTSRPDPDHLAKTILYGLILGS